MGCSKQASTPACSEHLVFPSRESLCDGITHEVAHVKIMVDRDALHRLPTKRPTFLRVRQSSVSSSHVIAYAFGVCWHLVSQSPPLSRCTGKIVICNFINCEEKRGQGLRDRSGDLVQGLASCADDLVHAAGLTIPSGQRCAGVGPLQWSRAWGRVGSGVSKPLHMLHRLGTHMARVPDLTTVKRAAELP